MASALAASTCAPTIKAEVIRLIKLDSCGIPVTGASAEVLAFDAFTEIANSPQYEEGQRFLQRKANGDPCINQKDASFLNWVQQNVTMCTLDPRVSSVATGARLLSSATTGIGAMHGTELLNARFSVEVWTPVAGSSACSEAGVQQHVYWIFPHMFDAKVQDFTFQNDAFTLAWQAMTEDAPAIWQARADAAVTGSGIGSTPTLYLGAGNTVNAGDHWGYAITSVAPPTPFCGSQVGA